MSTTIRADVGKFCPTQASAILSQSNETINTVISADDENEVYVLKNIDETVSSLKSGDIFSCEYGENEVLVAKVATIEINGNKKQNINETLTSDKIKLEIGSKKIGKLELSGSLSLGDAASLKACITLKYQYFEVKIYGEFRLSL